MDDSDFGNPVGELRVMGTYLEGFGDDVVVAFVAVIAFVISVAFILYK